MADMCNSNYGCVEGSTDCGPCPFSVDDYFSGTISYLDPFIKNVVEGSGNIPEETIDGEYLPEYVVDKAWEAVELRLARIINEGE